MTDNRNHQSADERQNQDARLNKEGDKKQTNDPQTPQDRLKDGTNDFQSGDQEPTSEQSSKEKNAS